ncbi:MAG: hypothetical protein ACE5G5_12965 [Candidatus Methylomirabilales bacterium]
MTMRDLHNNIAVVGAIHPRTIVNSGSPENLVSGDIDLQGFNGAEIIAHLGDIDELGGSPVGSAKVELVLEHADEAAAGDDTAGTYSFVALADVLGPTSVSSGIVASTTADGGVQLQVGYIGDKRFIRVTLQPTGLTNGGPISAAVIKGIPRHAPQ